MSSISFRFGTFRFDSEPGILYEENRPTRIGRRAAVILQTLLEAGGEVVTKSNLLDAAWPDLCVEEANIAVHISELRSALHDNAREPVWIDTVPGVGYYFRGNFTISACNTVDPDTARCDRAYRHFELGCSLLMRSPAGNRSARAHLARAIQLKPDYSSAFAFLSIGHFGAAQYYREDVQSNYALGTEYAKKAVLLNPNDASALAALGYAKLYSGKSAQANEVYQTARHVDPQNANILIHLVDLNVLEGRPEDAIGNAHEAIHRVPNPSGWYRWNLAFACYAGGYYQEAVEALQSIEAQLLPAKRILAASMAQLGRLREATLEAKRFMHINPRFRVSEWAEYHPFVRDKDRRHFVDGYTKAGLPL